MKANCPSCGAEVEFKSSVSVFAVCEFCKFMLVRQDLNIEALGKMAQLPDDVSPLKIGSRGKYKDSGFEVIGRLKVAWSEGYWNEWFILFDDGKQGWLAEAMGFFMLSSEVKNADRIPVLRDLQVGGGYELIPMRTYFVDDIKEAVCVASEGELPFQGFNGRKTMSVDLSDPSGAFACIEYSDEGPRLYVGTYVDFEKLGMSNLRDLESEIRKIRSAESFKCPSCGGPFSLLTPGHTASVACKYCGATIDMTDKNLNILSRAERQIKITPEIPIGSKGKLQGTTWEITGFMRRCDGSEEYSWDEYLLFNPIRGFRWLTVYEGEWNFVEMMRTRPIRGEAGPEIRFRNKVFTNTSTERAKVLYVLGEFYWRVKIGDTVDVSEYECPGETLTCESDSSEAVWSLGKSIESDEVRRAFAVAREGPKKEKTAGTLSSSASIQKGVVRAFWMFALLLTIAQIYFVATAQKKEIFRESFAFSEKDGIHSPASGASGDFGDSPVNPSPTNQAAGIRSVVTPSFDVPGTTGTLEVSMESSVQNDWVDAAVDLVNEKNNSSIPFDQEVEFYSGSDSDGSWEEGSRTSHHLLSSIAGGRYHLIVQPSGSKDASGEKTFSLTVRRGGAIWSNYFLALFLLALYPVITCIRTSRSEMKRNLGRGFGRKYGSTDS